MRRLAAGVIVGALALTACGDGGSDDPTPGPAATVTATASMSPSATTHVPVSETGSTPTTVAATPTPEATAEATTAPVNTPATANTPTPVRSTPVPPTAVPPTPVPPTATPTTPAAAQSATVLATDSGFFSPGTVTIAAGGTVTWNWQGGAFHDVASDAFASDPAGLKKTGSYSVTFTNPGTYAYKCSIHVLTGMRGTVIVK